MMDSSNLTTLCLIAVGVGLLILIAAALLLSVLRGSIFGLGMMLMRMISEQPAEETRVDLSAIPQSPSQDLRRKAQSLDFEATVSQYRQQDAPPAAQAAPPETPFPPPPIPQPPPSVQGFPAPKSQPRQDDDPLKLK